MNTSQELMVTPAPYRILNGPPPGREFTVKDLLNIFARRKAIIFSTTAVFLVVGIFYCVFSTRRYSATAEIQVEKESNSPLGLDAQSGDGATYSDSLQDAIAIQNQASILQSDSLALKVIHELNLESTDDFKPSFNPVGWALGLVSPKGPSDSQLGAPGETDQGISPRERMAVLGVFTKNLKVKPVSGTHLIDVSYLSSSPRVAAEVVNHLTQALNDFNFETRHDATARTAKYLTEQLADIRKQSEDLQMRLAKAQRESGVLSLGGVDAQGRDQVYSAVLDKLQQATLTLSQAQSLRITKEAIYDAAKNGDAETITNIGTGMSGSAVSDDLIGLIQSLRMQETTLAGQIAETSAKFGPAYPKLIEMQQRLGALDDSIKSAIGRVAERARNDAQVAKGVEDGARRVFLALKAQADALNDKTIAYTLLRQEADESRTLYETLFKQLKQAGVLADFRVSNISVVDPARVPARPAKPNVPLILAGVFSAGLFFGLCGALLSDTLDSKIRSMLDLKSELGQLPLGLLPYHDDPRRRGQTTRRSQVQAGSRQELALPSNITGRSRTDRSTVAALSTPNSAYVEAIRSLRTSVLLARGGSPPQVLLVTSSIASEGKSMLSVNLAILLAQQGKRVLLVDGDFRRPSLHRTLQIPNTDGLSSFLAGHSSVSDPTEIGIYSNDVPGLTILSAGPVPPYPAELLGSAKMRETVMAWRQHFDFILIDGAPVLPVTDSVVLSTLVDFTLLVVRFEITERQSLDHSYRLLEGQTERSKIGVVLNAVPCESSTYYQYYGYKDSAYYRSEKKYA